MDVTEPAVASPVLVVGGTGMLAGVVGALVREGLTTVVVSRNPPAPAAFGSLGTAGGVLIPVGADYTEPERFARTLRRAAARTGPFRQAVLWVHAEGRPHAYAAVADTLAQDASVIEVVGSGALAPTAPPPRPPEAFDRRTRHRTVVLGFTGDGPHTRWLDHGEIGTGVLAALRAPEGDRLRVVGRVRPWEDRPSA
ncbi:hypothetical protein ACFZBM_38250 [Streptomyces lavendulae]|uniref:Short chain dehydrogenase n=2 Tax=Streptomycetaceae TaxID=2062 RepID=A0A068L8F0_KITAU|nr:hypothetical protein [Streptomyces lavendulae]AIE42012.1 short chain dehydrogenase [Streptomyces lavendulae subsp. lavendulae]ATZ29678.1 short chain dehydrogenase [Streptomyces lavendulae subsp. lavendulae]